MRDLTYKKRDRLTAVLFAVYLLLLSWLVLFKLQFSIPVLEKGRVISFIPFPGIFGSGGDFYLSEIRNNALAFIPFGIYIGMLFVKWPFWKKALAAALLSLAFELTQFIFIIGRADITDLLSNTLGGVIGAGVYSLAAKCLKGRTNAIINIFAAVLTGLICGFIAFLMIKGRWIRII